MRYQRIDPVSREVAEAAARAAVPEELAMVILAVSLHEPDGDWAEAYCTTLAGHADPLIRGMAIFAFGHLARVHRRLDRSRVAPIVEAALADPDDYVRSQAESAADDLRVFLGWRLLPGPRAGSTVSG